MREVIRRNIRGKQVLLLFVITNLVYAAMLLITIPKVMAFSNGMDLLDMRPTGYQLEYIHALFEALGKQGRETYLFNQIPVDMVYPLLFGISYCLLLAYFLNKVQKLDGTLFYLCLLPLMAGSADYLENIGIINMLTTYPDLSSLWAASTNIFTIIKSITTTLYFVVLIATLIVVGIKAIRRSKGTISI